LATYVSMKPGSVMAILLEKAVNYVNVMGSKPTDSFPGTTALYTGATPRTSGVWYDDVWDRSLYTFQSNCTGTPGFEVLNDETIDVNSTALDGGGAFNLTHLSYYKTSWGSCAYLLPHNWLRVKTIFEVVRENGGFTKMTDKHPSYEIFNGPSGTGIYVHSIFVSTDIKEGYFPEINAVASTVGPTEVYDDLHWQAMYNWTGGNFRSPVQSLMLIEENGTKDPHGTPNLYTSNFQLFSVAQKEYGYLNGSTSAKPIFNPNVTAALDIIDANIGTLVARMKTAGTYSSTLLIVCAKHGQAPIDPNTLHLIDPSAITNATNVSLAQVTSDDIGLIWLTDPTIENVNQAKSDFIKAGASIGIRDVIAGPEVWQHGYGDPRLDPRVPDIIIQVTPGVIYTSVTATKVMEHGGLNPDDLTTAIFVHNPSISAATVTELVFTRQIAVTALTALGAPVNQLDGAQQDGTVVLPGLF